MKYRIDAVRTRENFITLNEQTIGRSPDSGTTLRVEDERHKPVKLKHIDTRGDDVSQIYSRRILDREFGSGIRFPYERGKGCYLLVHYEERQVEVRYNEELITKRTSMAHKRMGKPKGLVNMEIVHVATEFWKEYGLKALVVKSKHKLQGIDNDYGYSEWYELTKSTDEELAEQRKYIFDFKPMLFIVILAYETPEYYLREMLGSIMEQIYTDREICVVDGSPRREGPGRVLKRYADHDRYVRYEILSSDRRISGNTNAALDMARGDLVTLADHDDTLPPNAFYEVVKTISENPDCRVIYSGEDKLDVDGKALFDPHFKPDFNPDLLTSVNYICHLSVMKQGLLKQMGGFRQEFDGAQNYDFIFRCTEAAKRVYHVPKALCHWRCHQNSTASNPENKIYVFEAGSRAIMAHYEQMGILSVMVEEGVDYGIYHTMFEIQGEPLMSVIIPNKDRSQDLDMYMRSLVGKSSYRDPEFIIMENNSPQKETSAYHDEIQAGHSNFRVVIWKEGFSYSAINNYGVSFVKGKYLLLLNNGTELIDGGSIKKMLGFCRREDVGTMGVRLLRRDGIIQYAGVVIDFGGIVGHTLIGLHKAGNSYFHGAMCTQDYSAVMAVCLMTKKSVFDQVGGLSSELAVTFNNIDYYMKIRTLGKLIVYVPHSCFYHHEPKPGESEDTLEKIARLSRKVAIFIRK